MNTRFCNLLYVLLASAALAQSTGNTSETPSRGVRRPPAASAPTVSVTPILTGVAGGCGAGQGRSGPVANREMEGGPRTPNSRPRPTPIPCSET